MKQSELKKGEIYASSYPDQGEYIFECIDGSTSGGFVNSYKQGSFNSSRSLIVESNGFMEFRETTEEEKNWLNYCLKMNRYIPFNEVPQYSYQIY